MFGVSTATPRPRPAASNAVGARPLRALRVLVAEDNPVNRKLVTTLLQKRGHRVTAVENGRDAVEARSTRRRRPFDVVLMDVQMPEMSGFEADRGDSRARSDGERRHVPIVALTAHAMQGDRERCLAAGMDGYLAKPIDVEELIATVERFGRCGAASRRRAAADAARAADRSSTSAPRWKHSAAIGDC